MIKIRRNYEREAIIVKNDEKFDVKKELLNKMDYFILDENQNIIPANFMDWSNFLEKRKVRIVKQEKMNDKYISTVFLGLDHSFNGQKLEIFETMVFDDAGRYIYLDRYATWKEAEEGHQKAIEWVKDGCKS
jgi:hypothetical protein